MALLLIVLGIVLWLTVAPVLGIILVVLGILALLAAPGPYGFRGRY